MKKVISIIMLLIFTVAMVKGQTTIINGDTIRKSNKEIINYGTMIENNGGTVNITQSGTPRGGVTEIHHEVIVDKSQSSQPEVDNVPSEDALMIHAMDTWKTIIIVILLVCGPIAFLILKNKFKSE